MLKKKGEGWSSLLMKQEIKPKGCKYIRKFEQGWYFLYCEKKIPDKLPASEWNKLWKTVFLIWLTSRLTIKR